MVSWSLSVFETESVFRKQMAGNVSDKDLKEYLSPSSREVVNFVI